MCIHFCYCAVAEIHLASKPIVVRELSITCHLRERGFHSHDMDSTNPPMTGSLARHRDHSPDKREATRSLIFCSS